MSLKIIDRRSVIVGLIGPDENPAVHRFEVRLQNGTKEQSCSIPSDSKDFECEIGNLDQGSSYTIEARACVPGVCSLVNEANFTGPPASKFYLMFIFKS